DRRVPVGHAGDEQPEPDARRRAGQRGEGRHALERLPGAVAVQRLEVVEAPGAVEAEVLGETDPVDDLVPWHPLLCDVESEAHRRNLPAAPVGRPRYCDRPMDPSESHLVTDVDVLVVGAGITGIYQLHRALEEGFSALLVDAGDGVGGTWHWNRYPGARFDSESYTYGYFFSQELFDEWEWEEHFAGQPEIERYLEHVIDRFDLRRHMRLGARVTAAEFDAASATWTVTTA